MNESGKVKYIRNLKPIFLSREQYQYLQAKKRFNNAGIGGVKHLLGYDMADYNRVIGISPLLTHKQIHNPHAKLADVPADIRAIVLSIIAGEFV